MWTRIRRPLSGEAGRNLVSSVHKPQCGLLICRWLVPPGLRTLQSSNPQLTFFLFFFLKRTRGTLPWAYQITGCGTDKSGCGLGAVPSETPLRSVPLKKADLRTNEGKMLLCILSPGCRIPANSSCQINTK